MIAYLLVAGCYRFVCFTVNECVSVPCQNSGVCVDTINGFSCNCTAYYEGGLCQTDINECATDNGGCAGVDTGVGACVNLKGAFYCIENITPNITADYPSVGVATVQFTEGFRTQALAWRVRGPFPTAIIPNYVAVNLSTSDNTEIFRCTMASGTMNPVTFESNMLCWVDGFGRNLHAVVHYQNNPAVRLNSTLIHYPVPTITQNRLRLNISQSETSPTGAIVLIDNAAVVVVFDGTNFPTVIPGSMQIGVGPPLAPRFPCVLQPVLSKPTSIYCQLAENGVFGSNLVFTVTVGPTLSVASRYVISGVDTISVPQRPLVYQAVGCRNILNGTVDCPVRFVLSTSGSESFLIDLDVCIFRV